MTKYSIVFAATLLAAPAYAGGHASGDAAAGESAFKQCQTCHVIENEDGETLAGRNAKTGPNLYGVTGRTAGSLETYARKNGKKLSLENSFRICHIFSFVHCVFFFWCSRHAIKWCLFRNSNADGEQKAQTWRLATTFCRELLALRFDGITSLGFRSCFASSTCYAMAYATDGCYHHGWYGSQTSQADIFPSKRLTLNNSSPYAWKQ